MQPNSGLEILELEQDVSVSGVSLPHDEYRYEPLITEDAVRVLVLEPADHFNSSLCCSIIQHQRDSQSRSVSGCEYSAVSYTWGGCELSHQLLVRSDAQSWSYLRITANVDSLLRHFRAPHKARLFWIDAISLNQKDEIEKTQQIPLMGRIYDDAKRVRIWLGDNDVDEARETFSIIRNIGHDDQYKVTKEELECLAQLFNRPWFTRRWVIQEAVFSHDAAFHCGIHKLSLSRVISALAKIDGAEGHEIVSFEARIHRPNSFLSQLKSTLRKLDSAGGLESVGYGARMLVRSIGSRHFGKKGLLYLLWEFQDSECSDPRDRIAAVYALVTDGMRPLLQYGSRNWKEIYMDVASYFFNKLPAFDPTEDPASANAVLLHLYHFGPVETQRSLDCPSWIPNWSTRRKSSVPYGPGEPRLYSCEIPRSTNFKRINEELYQMLWPASGSELSDSVKKEQTKLFHSLKMNGPACMKTEVIGQILRLKYNTRVFFQECGKADLVINCSTGPEFWHQLVEALGIPTVLSRDSVNNYDPHENSLLALLAQILVKRDQEADEVICLKTRTWRPKPSLESHMKQLLEELHAHRDNPQALVAPNKPGFQHISTSLRHLSIIRVQASTRSYWALGPPTSQVGDWVVPLLLSQRRGSVPTIHLRPICSGAAEIGEPQRTSQATGIEERCLRYLGASIAEVDCLHIKARFVGPGSHCHGKPFPFPASHYETVSQIMLTAAKAAMSKGLPGPIVFDVA